MGHYFDMIFLIPLFFLMNYINILIKENQKEKSLVIQTFTFTPKKGSASYLIIFFRLFYDFRETYYDYKCIP